MLTPQETDELFEQLILLRDGGHSIIFISHKLEEVKRICSRVTVLRHGYCLGSYDLADMNEEDISRLMVGRDVVLKLSLIHICHKVLLSAALFRDTVTIHK